MWRREPAPGPSPPTSFRGAPDPQTPLVGELPPHKPPARGLGAATSRREGAEALLKTVRHKIRFYVRKTYRAHINRGHEHDYGCAHCQAVEHCHTYLLLARAPIAVGNRTAGSDSDDFVQLLISRERRGFPMLGLAGPSKTVFERPFWVSEPMSE